VQLHIAKTGILFDDTRQSKIVTTAISAQRSSTLTQQATLVLLTEMAAQWLGPH
jgi:hypothetical protein